MTEPHFPRWGRKMHPSFYEKPRGCTTANGMHDPLTDREGRCLFCGAKIDQPQPEYIDPRISPESYLDEDPLSIDGPDEGDYYAS